MDAVKLSRSGARRFLIHRLGLGGFQTMPDVSTALDALGFVQMDSINVCGRIHDLILWSRVSGYRPKLLEQALYGERRIGFEYYFPNLSVLPIREYRYFVRDMRQRGEAGARHALADHEHAIADSLLAQAAVEPIRTRTLDAEHGRTTSAWGTQTTVSARVVHKLWMQGRMTIHRREGFERWYAPTDRIAPDLASIHANLERLPSPEETERERTLIRMRAKRLFRPKKAEAEAVGEAALIRVDVEDLPKPWYALRDDLPLLREAESLPFVSEALLIAPLDPLIHDRTRLEELFEFDYRWEVYTPAAKRRWGYYVVPILQGDRLVGRVDPKLDSATGVLTLHALWIERETDAEAIAERLRAFALFLGAKKIQLTRVEPSSARKLLKLSLKPKGRSAAPEPSETE